MRCAISVFVFYKRVTIQQTWEKDTLMNKYCLVKNAIVMYFWIQLTPPENRFLLWCFKRKIHKENITYPMKPKEI